MTSNLPLDLNELGRAARSATPGEWQQRLSPTGNRAAIYADGYPYIAENLAPVDGEYLLAFQPAVTRQLVTELSDAQATILAQQTLISEILALTAAGATAETIQALISTTMKQDTPDVVLLATTIQAESVPA